MEPEQGNHSAMKNLRKLHLIVGLAGFVAFVLTGQYMEWAHDHLDGMADAPRMMYRSAHIYTLYSALLNVLLGAYIRPMTGISATRLQLVGSILILVVPVLLQVSFFVESQNNNPLSRPIAVAGIYLSLLGVALHLFASLQKKDES